MDELPTRSLRAATALLVPLVGFGLWAIYVCGGWFTPWSPPHAPVDDLPRGHVESRVGFKLPSDATDLQSYDESPPSGRVFVRFTLPPARVAAFADSFGWRVAWWTSTAAPLRVIEAAPDRAWWQVSKARKVLVHAQEGRSSSHRRTMVIDETDPAQARVYVLAER